MNDLVHLIGILDEEAVAAGRSMAQVRRQLKRFVTLAGILVDQSRVMILKLAG